MDTDDVQEMYRIDREAVFAEKKHSRKMRDPGEIVRIQFKNGDIKRYAWRFAEPLILSGRAVME